MKRRWVLIMLFVLSVIYITTTGVVLFMFVEPVKRGFGEFVLERGLSLTKVDLIYQLQKAECLCSKPQLSSTLNISKTTSRHEADLDRHACNMLEVNQTSADIQVSALYSTLQLHYDRYALHHRGWISHYDDLTYSSSQWDQEVLDVYVVPFSHQDPGWKSSMEKLFREKTKKTIDYMVEFLTSDPNMTFVWSEIIFLEKWYSQADAEQQNKLKKLLSRGQLELLTGGWVMTDEAVTHYYAMLDQLIEGHQWLYNVLNYTASTAWSLDSFGVSPTMTYILQGSGISNLLVQRIHYNLKRALADRKQLQFLWRQTWDHKGSSDLFTHVPPFLLYNILYNCGPDPETCCQFDFVKRQCYSKGKYVAPEPVGDGNIKEMAWVLLDQLRKKAQFFTHDKLLMLYGDDFRFFERKDWQSLNNNLKQLITYMNSERSMHIKLRFSTLSEYFKSVKSTLTSHQLSVPSLSGDFFTYNDRDDQYWSGFFTSRPMFKHMTRILQQKLRSAEILFTLLSSQVNNENYQKLRHLTSRLWMELEEGRRVLGLSQHHDAITGTSAAHTMMDYFTKVHRAVFKVDYVAAASISFLLQYKVNLDAALNADLCDTLDIQMDVDKPIITRILDNSLSILVVFNPLPLEREEFITVTVLSPFVMVEDMKQNPIGCQVAPMWADWLEMEKYQYKLTFVAVLKPLAITRFSIRRVNGDTTSHCPLVDVRFISPVHNHNVSSVFHVSWRGLEDFVLSSPLISAYFCGCNGLLQGILDKSSQIYHESNIKFVRYGTGSWTNPFHDKSGAYIFLPNGPAQELDMSQPKIMVTFGPLVNEVYTILPLVTHRVTIYNTEGSKGAAVHIKNIVNLEAYTNTELAMRISTNINNERTFYTDNNGFQMQKRTYLPKYKIQGNYYPIATQIFIEDDLYRATVHTAYSHGASSLSSGAMEVMLDRRLNQDDWRGLGAGITDNVVTPSQFILLIETNRRVISLQHTKESGVPSLLSHQMSLRLNTPPELFIQQKTLTHVILPHEPLTTSWPCDIQLVNLRSLSIADNEAWHSLLIVHRFAYSCIYTGVYEQCRTSNGPIPLSRLFSSLKIQKAWKTSLTGLSSGPQLEVTSVELEPMEIKTYKIRLSWIL